MKYFVAQRTLLASFLVLGLSSAFLGIAACSEDTGLNKTANNSNNKSDAGDQSQDADHALDVCNDSTCASDSGKNDDAQTNTGDTTSETCSAQNQCGPNCCTAGELCLQDQCVTPGDACVHTLQCPPDNICEPTLERCIPKTGQACIYKPETDIFDPVIQTAWVENENTPAPAHKQVMMTPAVVDITGNGTPDIVFTTFAGSQYNLNGILRAVDGRTYEPVFDFVEEERRVNPNAAIALGDIDGDGNNEIVAVRSNGQGLIAFDDHTTDYAIKWVTEDYAAAGDGPALADLNGDGNVEVISRNRVFSGKTGELLCMNTEVSNGAFHSLAVDLDGDGQLEILTGGGAFKFEPDGQGGYNCPTYWKIEKGAGKVGVGDFGTFTGATPDFANRDGFPEVVTIYNSGSETHVQLVNGQNGKSIWSSALPTTGHPIYTDTQCATTGAGDPTVADFDGDGRAEVATAGACFYYVFKNDGTMHWRMPTRDFSSRATGSSVFDFQGDGRAEVVYADECFLRVYDGKGNGDGTTDILFEVANTSGTLRELPVIVDVDGDFHADIVLMSNDYGGPNFAAGCAAQWGENFYETGGATHGIRVIKDSQNRWVSTRPVWNQHAYHVTNVCDGLVDATCPGTVNKAGAIPRHQVPNHATSTLNNYRQNVQGDGLFNAPDLVIASIDATCTETGMTIAVTVGNQGDLGVLPGLKVAVYAQIKGDEQLVTILETTQALPPGARETLTFDWATNDPSRGDGTTFNIRAHADQDENATGQHNECIEDNNMLQINTSCGCRDSNDCESGYYCLESTSLCTKIPG